MGRGVPTAGKREMTGLKEKHPAEYVTWQNMLRRCAGFGRSGYYKARGISVSKRWRSFAAFMTDMGPRPKGRPREWTLERKNNDRGYTPANCKWATAWEQAQNRRPRSK